MVEKRWCPVGRGFISVHPSNGVLVELIEYNHQLLTLFLAIVNKKSQWLHKNRALGVE